MIDFNDTNRAIYLQIADDISDRVLTGALPPDERVPSVREYAATMMVNVNTVMRAYDHLQSLGIIYNRRGLGYFVAPGGAEKVAADRRAAFIEGGGLERMFKQLSLLGIGPKELSEMYESFISNSAE